MSATPALFYFNWWLRQYKISFVAIWPAPILGPSSRQCLPVPDPFHRVGIWEPQVNYDPTKCVEGRNLQLWLLITCHGIFVGPASKQCLPTPHPNTAFWIPQDITNCVPGIVLANSVALIPTCAVWLENVCRSVKSLFYTWYRISLLGCKLSRNRNFQGFVIWLSFQWATFGTPFQVETSHLQSPLLGLRFK